MARSPSRQSRAATPGTDPGARHVGYRLLPLPPARAPIRLTSEQAQVVGNRLPRLRVLAGPGTGKTATLVESVAERVLSGRARPEEILVLTFSRRAAAELSQRIAGRLGITTREPMVRTLHSYAYELVRAQAARSGEPAPRLLAAGESDQMVRELLAGHRESGGGSWPEFLRGALGSPAFAAELRDQLLRTAERGLRPHRIAALGRRLHRPEWVSAAAFAVEYQQVGDLRQVSTGLGIALDQAELTVAALTALADDEVLAAEQRRLRRIFVDEYQDVDPAQARLIEVVASGAAELVVAGDPDQAIYGFRGSEPAALRDIAVDETVALTRSRRMAPALLPATRRVAALIPGPVAHRRIVGGPLAPGDDPGSVVVTVLPSAPAEAGYLADQLRRAHLFDGVPFAEMAVLMRSPAAQLPALTRAFAVAGVPVVVGRSDQILAADPVVAALLAVLRHGLEPASLTGDVALELLASPLAGLDALAVRRLRRAVRSGRHGEGSSADLVAAVLAGARLPQPLPADLGPAVHRLVDLLSLARDQAAAPTAEEVLWQLWRRAGLEGQLVAESERGGRGAQRADRTLDAVLALFAVAADLADRLPLAGVGAFVALVEGQHIPDDPDPRGARVGEAVSLLSAHAAKGLEWDVVAVAGVQDGSWPDLRMRGSLLGTAELLDAADGAPLGRSRTSEALAEERRLFYVAVTRARRRVICTAVSNEEQAPSRFLSELIGTTDELPVLTGQPGRDPGRRSLHLVDLVADLRRAVTDPDSPAVVAQAAAAHLAALSDAGVRGAHPRDWYGLAEPSTDLSPVAAGQPVRLSPSLVETLSTCALRAVLERRGGGGEPSPAQIEGIVVHALAHGLAAGVSDPDLRAELDEFLDSQEQLPPWQRARTRRSLLSMLEAARTWVQENHPPRRLVGSEVGVDVQLSGSVESAGHPVQLAGRVDWLSERPDGTLVVTDFKTGASVPTRAEAAANPQLATYQTAVELGAFDGVEQPDLPAGIARSGGAELVYLRTGKPKVLPQPALTEADRVAWLGTIRSAAGQLAAAQVWAQQNARCERCPVRSSCPAQERGRQVTR